LAADSRFEIVRRGYDPQPVERELKSLNAELVRLKEQNSELQQQVADLAQKLADADVEVGLRTQPSYSALGTKASSLLSTAEQVALELGEKAREEARGLVETAEAELFAKTEEVERRYQEQLDAAERRSARRISEATIEAEQIIAKAERTANSLIATAEAEAGRLRGQVATEIAAMRTTAKRELEAREQELEARYASKEFLLTSDVDIDEKRRETLLAELEAQITQRRKDAEAEYLAKHNEAVRQTQQYLESAQKDITDLKQAAKTLRLEVETLELETSKTQARMLAEAREKAESLVRSAELEAVATGSKAQDEAANLVRNARAELAELENKVLSSKTYLENLRSVVAELEKD
jgi:cell division septum initiation protein DivIVA